MTLTKVSPGQPMRITAADWNACLDAASAYQRGRLRQAAPDEASARESGRILVRNDTGLGLDRFSVVGLGVPLILPGDNLRGFSERIALAALQPQLAHLGRLAILQEPLRNGTVGQALVAGATPCRVRGDPLSGRADVDPGSSQALLARPDGAVQVLWRDGSGTAESWAVVLLAGSPRSHQTAHVVDTGAAHGFSTGTILRTLGGGYARALAGTAAEAQALGVVGQVISATAFLLVTGGLIDGLAGLVPGARYYLSSTVSGGFTATAPGTAVPVFDAVGTDTAIITLGSGGGGSLPGAADDGWALATDTTGAPAWTRDLDLGRNAAGATGKLRLLGASAAGVAVEIDAALVPSAARKLSIREIDICDAGTAKKALVLMSAPY